MLDLTLGDQVLDGTGNIFDRHLRIDTMLVEEINAVSPQPRQTGIRYGLDVLGSAIGSHAAFAGLHVNVKAELGCDSYLIANRCQRLSDKLLVDPGAINLSRVEQCHATVVSGANELNHLLLVGRRSISGAHAHASKSECRYLKIAVSKLTFLHIPTPLDHRDYQRRPGR